MNTKTQLALEELLEYQRLHPEEAINYVSMQVVHFLCGACQEDYEVELLKDTLQMVACPHCGNCSLQMVRGTA